MSKLSIYIKSMRLRTLPLSLAGCGMGILLAMSDYKINFVVVCLIILTTIFLQILSNLSNELGDVINGTDTPERQGPKYGLNSGEMTIIEMKILIRVFIILTIISGIAMIIKSFGTLFKLESICILLLGISAIISGMKYTLGKNPYGYRGLGDIFVFIYFGIVSVLGSYFIATHTIPTFYLLLPAFAIGFLSVSVLNVNNMRDIKTDAENRVTVAIMLGIRGARIYQTILIILGWICMLAFCQVRFFDPWHYLFVITLPLFLFAIKGIWTLTDKKLDPMLPLIVISTFLFAILSGIGFIIFLF